MRHLFPTLFFLLAALWLPAQSWTLSWSDEFNGTGIDNTKWGYDIGTGAAQGLWGWGNGELQYYTDDNDNADVVNGNLVITARQENFAGSNYTSARMVTRNKFSQTYGKWEARIDLPTGQGIWPAFWMLRENNPWPGEIDIMEIVGHLPGNCHGTAHWGEVGDVQSMGGTITAPDWTTAFHIYTVEWWPDHIRWSVDGQVYFELDRTQVTPVNPWLFAEDYHMLLNVAVGGQWPGSPDATTVFPQEMKVDWVRVYEHVPEPQPITFRVDLSEASMEPGDQVYVTGSFDGWTGNTHALSDGGNGIWSTTLDLPQGIHEYKFTVNGWTGSEESFSPGAEGTLTSYGDNGQTFV
ncbi:MAG: family 16 glycosylhydrolase, partial [Bacteroidota bacterium]|nr:family 16 glycosylhydrolase [Bacteroidota bacterium]